MRFQKTVRPTLPSFSVAPMTATDDGEKNDSRGFPVTPRTSLARSRTLRSSIWAGSGASGSGANGSRLVGAKSGTGVELLELRSPDGGRGMARLVPFSVPRPGARRAGPTLPHPGAGPPPCGGRVSADGVPSSQSTQPGGTHGHGQARRALLEPVHRLAGAARGRRARRPARLRLALDVGPRLPDRRRLPRAELRGLADAGGVGPGDRARPDRADGGGQHVPQPGPRGQDGDDARPRQRRAGHPRRRRCLVRRGARGLRDGVRQRLPGAAPLARRGAPDHARDAGRDRADRDRPALHVPRDAQPPAARPGPPPDLHRRRRRAGDPQARGEVRRHEQPGRRRRDGEAQGGDPPGALRGGGARSGRDRAFGQRRDRLHPRRPGGGRAALPGGLRTQPGRDALEGPAGGDAGGRGGEAGRRTWRSATGTWSRACPRRTTRSR